jgi:hypothetical protein
MSKSSVSNYDNSLYLSGLKIFGVTEVNYGYSLPIQHINVIGFNKFATFTSGPPSSSFSLQKYLSPNDWILGLTGNFPISGVLSYNSKKFGFDSGYLNSYSVSCSVGNFPVLNADFGIFGDIGGAIGTTTSNQTGVLKVIRPADISVTCDGSTTNRIESFTYSVDCPRQAIYGVTGAGPMAVIHPGPFKVNAQFSMGVDDYESKKLFDYVVDSNKKNINITIGTLATFSMANMELIGETINSSATNELMMTLNYQGFI